MLFVSAMALAALTIPRVSSAASSRATSQPASEYFRVPKIPDPVVGGETRAKDRRTPSQRLADLHESTLLLESFAAIFDGLGMGSATKSDSEVMSPRTDQRRRDPRLLIAVPRDRAPWDRRTWLRGIPSRLAMLEEVSSRDLWDEDDTLLASLIARYIRLGDAPSFRFRSYERVKNRWQTEALLDWVRDEARKPASFAMMVLPQSCTAYCGYELELREPLVAAAHTPRDQETELIWAQTGDEPEPWIVQCVQRGKALWARRISTSPQLFASVVCVPYEGVESLGPFGWRVPFAIQSPTEKRVAHLYVSKEPRLMFYYVLP